MRLACLTLVGCLLLAVAAPALADLCPKCKGMMFTKDIGQCKECGGMTTSGAFKLCMRCSKKLGQCEHCRAPLAAAAEKIDFTKDGVYTSGPWQYAYVISNKGTRSEGYHGRLLHAGAAVPEPETVNDYYETPWGRLYWVGSPAMLFGGHGWMPKPKASAPVGKALPEPAAAHPVLAKVVTDGPFVTNGRKEAEAWVLDELKKLGVKEPWVCADWFPVGPKPVIIHSTKLYGEAALVLRETKADQPFAVEVTGPKGVKIELPRTDGATRVVKHTLEGLGQQLDLYLVFKVSLPASKAEAEKK